MSDAAGDYAYEDMECPLCMEEIDVTDKYFRPCPCDYQICRFCWNHIKEDLNNLCPACRRSYADENVVFKPVPPEELARIKVAKKKKEREKKEVDLAARKHLANVRVIQKNLVYVLGLPNRLASDEILKTNDYFGQYGKINKIVINRKPPPGSNPNAHSHTGVYITYARKEDATRAIEAVDGSVCDNRMIRATYGTTKYCSFFLKGQQCLNQGCQFLHEPGEEADSFTKDELIPQSKVTPKPPPFPYGSDGAEDKHDELHHPNEENEPLPAPSGWSKPTAKAQMDGNTETAFPDALHSAAAAKAPKTQTAIKRSSSTLATVVSDSNIPPPNNPAMFAPPSADVVPAVKPLKYIALQLDPLVINLAMSPRQPEYSGPFEPFREDSLFGRPPKAMGNSKSNELGSPEDAFGMQRGIPGNGSQPSAQDAFRSAFPNVNVVYGTQAGQQSSAVGNQGMGRAMGNGATTGVSGALGFPKGMEGLPGNGPGLPSQYENWEMGKSAQRF